MNVIRYDIEVRNIRREYFFQFWRDKESESSVKQHLRRLLENESVFEGDYQIALENKWNHLEKRNIRLLNPSSFLVGYTKINNTTIFLFDIDSDDIEVRNNISLQVFAFGSLPIEDILNESFSKIKNIFSNLNTKLINKSIIYIYPFNTGEQDIESPELKIEANLQSLIKFKISDIVRWGLVIIISLICLSWAMSTKEDQQGLKTTLKSLFGSGIFYVILDVIITIIVPFTTSKHKKKVIIENLSSVLERTNEMDELGQAEDLQIPQN